MCDKAKEVFKGFCKGSDNKETKKPCEMMKNMMENMKKNP